MTRRRLLVLVLSYVGVVLSFTVWFGTDWLVFRQFVAEGIETMGTIVETRCSEHGAIVYDYTVNGRTYRSRSNDGFGNPNCRDLKPGDPVRVCFLPQYPSRDCAGDPKLRLWNQGAAIAIAPIWFGIPFALMIWRESRRGRPKPIPGEIDADI